jgi:hypothetical protein
MSRQDIYLNKADLIVDAKKYNFPLISLSKEQEQTLEIAYPMAPKDPSLMTARNDQIFWRELGFKSVTSIDVSSYENATHILDLNELSVYDDLKNKHDWLFDFGTMEHVFHLPNYLKNIFDLLLIGGYMYCMLPCNNWVNHGFYQFSPTLLNDFYVQNNWKVISRYVYTINDHWGGQLTVNEYLDEESFVVPAQKLDDRFYYVGILARKEKNSTSHIKPQQYTYQKKQWAA